MMKKLFSFPKGIALLGVVLFGITNANVAQTIVPIGAGSTDKTIQGAYDAIKAAAVSTPIAGAYVLELQADYDQSAETFPVTLNAINGASALNNITIRPATGVSKTLVSDATGTIYNYSTNAASTIAKITVANVTGMNINDKVAGPGITDQTTVSAIDGNTITLSTPAATSHAIGNPVFVGVRASAAFANANVVSGQTVIKLNGPVTIQNGDFVTGTTSIPAGTTVTYDVATTTITLSGATTGAWTAGNVRLYFGPSTAVSTTSTAVNNFVPFASVANLVAGMTVSGSGFSRTIESVDAGSNKVLLTSGANQVIANATVLSLGNQQIKTIVFDGAKFVTIDGQSGGVGQTKNLTISATATASNPATIGFINDAYKNTVKYCNVLGAGVSTTMVPASGTIFIGTTTGKIARAGSAPNFTGSGNLYNTIDNCNIAEASVGTLPTAGVYMVGTATYTNEGNAITNCNIANYFNPGAFISSGIYNDLNSQTTTITGNKLYQTATRTYTAAGLHYPIYLNTAGLLTAITNNTIGYNNSNGTGTYTIDGNFAHRFAGIYINGYLGGNSTPVAGNTITDINYSSSSAGNGAEGVVVGIFQKAGNGIGSSTLSTALTPNTISNITLNYSVATTASFGLAGASYSFNSGAHNYSFCNIHDLSAIPTTNNIVGKVMGIFTTGSFGGSLKANTIYNLSCGTPLVSPGSTPSNSAIHIVTGISSSSASTQTVERNNVYGLNAISTGNSIITGIANSVGSYQTNLKNNIVRLGADVTSDATIYGLNYSMATGGNVFNYHNTVYISGTATKNGGPAVSTFSMFLGGSVAATNHTIQNNIFANQRVNSETGSAKHFAFRFAYTVANTIKVLDNNLYWATPLGYFGGTGPVEYSDLAAWKGTTNNTKILITNDAASIEGDPGFVSSTDLRIALGSTKVDSKGVTVATVTDDFYGSVRADLTASDLGAVAYTSTATGPTTTITSTATASTKTSPIPVVIKFSNTVTGFDASKITVSNGTLGTVSGSGNSYSVNVTPSGQGLVTVDVLAGVVTDAAGNGNIAGVLSRTFDNVAPTVAIAAVSPSNVALIPVTITFNEAVTGFDVTDLTLVNGTASNFVAVSATEYTVDITAVAMGEVLIDIAAGKAIDAASNGNAVAPQMVITYGITGLDNAYRNAAIYSVNQSIMINGSIGSTATIYSLDGQLLKSVLLTSDKVTVPSAKGFYIVKVGTDNTKVLVK